MPESNHLRSQQTSGTPKRTTLYMVFFAFLLGLGFTLVSFPGVLYSDSYARWDDAFRIIARLTHSNLPSIKSWLSITPQLFMAIIYTLTHHIAVYTFIQSTLFFYSTFLMIDRFVNHYTCLTIIFFVLCPIIYGFSVYHEMSTGCLIGLNFSILLLMKNNSDSFSNYSIHRKIIYFFLLTLSLYVVFGFRQNAYTLLPVYFFVIVYYFIKKHKQRILVIIQVLAICIALLAVSLIPSLLTIKVRNSASAGFIWEILCTIQAMPEEDQEVYDNYLDSQIGEGNTQAALEVNDIPSGVNCWLWSIVTPKIGDDIHRGKIAEKYIELAIKEPKSFIKMKTYFTLRTLGINAPLYNVEYEYNTWNRLQNFGMRDSRLRQVFVNSYNHVQNHWIVFRIPWIWFALAFIGTLWLSRLNKNNNSPDTWILLLFAVFYYAAFIITTQRFEFRYFFPSFYLLLIVISRASTTAIYVCLQKHHDGRKKHI